VKRNAIIAVVAGALVVILIWYFALYKPKSNDVSSTQDQVSSAQRAQQGLEATLARLRSLDKERPQQQATLDKLNAAIPESPDLADFIFQANTAAADSGVEWLSISPTPPVPSTTGGPSVIALNIQVQGGFFQVLDYLNRLEGLPRLVVTDTINLSAGAGASSGSSGSTTSTLPTATSDAGAPTLSVTLGARMFTRATVAPSAPGATGGTVTPAPSSSATTAPATPSSTSSSNGSPGIS
jgi:Tfp pilus assembly protein PilO